MRLNGMVKSRGMRSLALTVLVGVTLGLPATSLKRATGGEPWTVEQATWRDVPVVMVALDELPIGTLMTGSGTIDRELFPNFARLASSSTWFRNATAPAPFTLEALPAILRGIPERMSETEEPGPDLFALLGSRYPVVTAGTEVRWCEPDLCNLHTTDATLPPDFFLYSSAARGKDVAAFLEVLGSSEPSFRFLHLVMPHGPLRYLPTGQRYPEADAEPGEVNPPGRGRAWGPYPWLVRFGFQRHLLQSMLTDRALGLILDRMHETGTWEESFVIVLADHGLGFVPRATKRLVNTDNIGHIAPVPLFVKLPGQTSGEVTDLPVETTDLAATIADVLDLSVGPGGTGRSMFSGSISPNRTRFSGGIPVSPHGRRAYDLTELKYSMFRRAGDSIDPYSFAPRGSHHLLGAPVASAPDGEMRVAATLGPYERAHPADVLFPALIEGRVLGWNGDGPARLAIAVNGRIAAVTRTNHWRGAHRFYAILDPADFGAPPNEIEIVEIDVAGNLRRAEIHPDAGPLTDALLEAVTD